MKSEYFLFTVIFSGTGVLFSLVVFLAFRTMEMKRAAGKQVLDEKAALNKEAKLRGKLRKLATYQEKILSAKVEKSSKTVSNEEDGVSGKDLPGIPVTPLSARNSVWARKNRLKKGLVLDKQLSPRSAMIARQPSHSRSNFNAATKGPANELEEIECSLTNLVRCNRTQEWFKYSSPGRTVFWQIFGVCFVLALFMLSVYIYGDAFGFFQAKNVWSTYTNWTFFEFSVIAISGTLTVIYFLPLLYVHHDFEAGRRFKNDPKFLRRIGVIIPCHKSAGEIGEVLRRVRMIIFIYRVTFTPSIHY